jgi:Caspase domain/TPR repeat/Tetratricopeptide repeat
MAASLLIGVSQYEDASFTALPAAAKDVDVLQDAFRHPNIGSLRSSEVAVLKDPSLVQLRGAIEALYSNRQPNELVVLYFSGYGVVDDRGRLFLASRSTSRAMLDDTALSMAELQACLEVCRSQQMVVILDCCFSGTFAKGMVSPSDVDAIGQQLSGKRCAVLTSPWSVEYSSRQKSGELSTYTQYLLNALETGMADGCLANRNLNGKITAVELHEYIRDRIEEEMPALYPKLYTAGQGYEITIANAPYLEFRREALGLAIQGEISVVGQSILDEMRVRLGIPQEIAASIRKDAIKPYQQKSQKRQQFEKIRAEVAKHEGQLSDNTRTELVRLQEIYELPAEARTELPTSRVEAPAMPVRASESNGAIVGTNGQTPVDAQPLDEEPAEENRFSRLLQNTAFQDRGFTPELLRMAIASLAVLGLLGAVLWVAFQPIQRAANRYSTSEDYFQEGFRRSQGRDRKAAIESYNQAIKLNPENAAAYYNRGIEYAKEGDRNQAIQNYSDAIKYAPTFADAYFNRGNAYFARGERTAALRDFKQAEKLYQQQNRQNERKQAQEAIRTMEKK